MPDGSYPQIALLDPKGCLRLSQLDVGMPEVFSLPAKDVAPQQVAPFAQLRPPPPLLHLLPPHQSPAIAPILDLHLEEARSATVPTQNRPHSPLHPVPRSSSRCPRRSSRRLGCPGTPRNPPASPRD